MPKYYVFDLSREGFDDGNGKLVSLGKHLDYIADYMGSWDCCGELEETSYHRMKEEVAEMWPSDHVAVVEEDAIRVVYISDTRTPQQKNEDRQRKQASKPKPKSSQSEMSF
ncbi:hypothetical protein AB4254_08630 [Vibrio breoganii]